MGYRTETATIEIYFECDCCGASGYEIVDGIAMVDDSFSPAGFVCPKCGEELESDL